MWIVVMVRYASEISMLSLINQSLILQSCVTADDDRHREVPGSHEVAVEILIWKVAKRLEIVIEDSESGVLFGR